MQQGYRDGLTLDRVNNELGYWKENCRWATYRAQANNKRGNVRIDTPHGGMTVSQASREFGVNVTTILYRIQKNWPVEALTLPANPRNVCTTSGIVVRGTDSQFAELPELS